MNREDRNAALCDRCVRDALASGGPGGFCYVRSGALQNDCEELRRELSWRRSRWHPDNYKKGKKP